MPRVVDREARRAEIVAAAVAAFAERGVANTAVSDIVKTAGVAQGTFYLYFESKDDVVLAVAERLGDAMFEAIEGAVTVPGRAAVEKLRALSDTFSDYTTLTGISELIEIMHRDGNRAIHDRLAEHLTPRLVAIVEGIIEEGVAEGVFAVPDIQAAAWFVLGGLRSTELSGVPMTRMPTALAQATAFALRALGFSGESA
jgi:AcrR family transcriptional regulator